MKFLFRFLLIVFCIFYSSKIKADFLTLDSHIDIPFDYMTNPEHDPGNKTDMQVDFQKMLEGNLDGGFFIVYVGQSELDKNGFQDAKKKAITKFNAIKKMVEKYPERIVLVKNPSEVYQAKREEKLFAAIGIENGYVIGEDIELLEYFYDLGARYMTLSHIGHNQISDSSLPKKSLKNDIEMHGGLSDFGKIVIKKMNELGMMIDISHVSDKSALQAVTLSKHPVIASHSGVRSVADHPRNIPDNIIKEVAKKGGVIQVVAFSSYVKVNKDRTNSIIKLRDSILKMTGDMNFLPEKHTDFIFTTLAEEFGFIGGISLLIVYALIVVFAIIAAIRNKDRFSSLLIYGVTFTFFLYFAVNMAMVMGLAPVVGVPLPLVSYGGSSLLVLMVAFGLLQSAHVHKPRGVI